MGSAVVQWLALSPYSEKVLDQGSSVWSLNVLPVVAWFSPGPPAFSHSPKTFKLGVSWLIGLFKLPVGVNGIVDGSMSLYIGPLTNWRLVHVVPRLCLKKLR